MEITNHKKNCEKCGAHMQVGFINTRCSIFFMPKERVIPKINSDIDCDIFHNTWRSRNLPSFIRRVIGYHCPACKILVVDYSREYVRNESRELTQKLIDEESPGR